MDNKVFSQMNIETLMPSNNHNYNRNTGKIDVNMISTGKSINIDPSKDFNSHNLLNVNSLNAEIIELSYNEQTDFPPKDEALNFDAEGLAYHNDSLWIITKCRSIPFEGNAYIYKFPTKAGKYNLKRKSHLFIGKEGFIKDAVTSLDIYNNKVYLLTYNRILIYAIIENKLSFENQYYIKPYSQKEALIVKNKNEIYLTDESTKILGGGYLYKLTLDATKIKH